MELRHLRYFVAVAEDLHFGHAANRLHASQSSLRQQIQNLETGLKLDLQRRVKRHVELTPGGNRFLRQAREIPAAAGLARDLSPGRYDQLLSIFRRAVAALVAGLTKRTHPVKRSFGATPGGAAAIPAACRARNG